MNTFFKTFFACLLAIIIGSVVSLVFFVISFAGFVSAFSSEESFAVKDNSILKIDLSLSMPDRPSSSLMDNIDVKTFKINRGTSLLKAVSLIEKAATDPQIKGILLQFPIESPNSFSTLYELRQAITNFRTTSGKFVIAHADYYSQSSYYLASCADKVYLNPQGALDWKGMSSSVMFYKGLFDKLGVEPEIIRHGKFKGAVEPFMLDKMSSENRLQMQSLLGSMWGYMVSEIGSSRAIDSTKLQLLASEMTITTPQLALNNGMVDSLYYTNQLEQQIATLTSTPKPTYVTLSQYGTAYPAAANGDILSDDQIAIVYASGEIVDGGDSEKNIVGNTFAEQIRKVRKDDNVKAVVIRVNSPGGSVLASDIVWDEVALTQKAKPVIVSMGEYAASGGYYISCPADMIVTNPTTLTGSIGVFGMMFNLEKAAREKLGITVDVVSTNPMADMGNMFRALSPAERMLMQNSVDSVYTRFVGLVAQGRKLSFGDVDSLAGGRVWSGLQAIDNKLADKIGSLKDAIAIAAERAGITTYRTKPYPEADDSFGALLQSLGGVSVQYIKNAIGITPQVDEIQQIVKQHHGVWAKMPYTVKLND